jgi:ABC-type oligopeptide transport system ATPase subunit
MAWNYGSWLGLSCCLDKLSGTEIGSFYKEYGPDRFIVNSEWGFSGGGNRSVPKVVVDLKASNAPVADIRKMVFDIVAEPIELNKAASDESGKEKMVLEALEDVHLTPLPEIMYRFPHELSGGQRQRVGVARAIVLHPKFIVADEPVSMLDVSIRAEILNLMLDLVDKFNVSFMYITHDIALARHMCDRMAVMYLGKIAEMGPTEKIVYEPCIPTQTP